MESIILCGMPASGKTTVARIISKKLNYQLVGGGDILKEMAKERGYKVSGEEWWDTTDGIKFLRERDTNPEFDKEVDKRVAQKIDQGNVIVTSYTAPWLSKHGFKVWLGASIEKRAQRMAKRDHTQVEESIKATKIRDVENTKLYKKLYKIDFGTDMRPFDLVIETDDIDARDVAGRILDAFASRNSVK